MVGDHCTDDTEAVVAGFADPRITWVNLAENAGEQSGPNNEGIRRARGRYLAFLNHDDSVFPRPPGDVDRLLRGDRGRPRVVAAAGRAARPGSGPGRGPGAIPPERRHPGRRLRPARLRVRVVLADAAGTGRAIGLWRSGRETFVTASQDWIFRAWRSGARLRFHAHVGVLAVPASSRAGSYPAARSPEHDHFAGRMAAPGFREAALDGPRSPASARRTASASAGRQPRRCAAWCSGRPAPRPWPSARSHAPLLALRHGRRGNLVSALRMRTGLDRLRRR